MTRTLVISLGVLAAIGAGLAWLLVSSFPDASNTGYRVTMRPTVGLSHRACQAEVRRLGMVVEATACSPRTDRPWFDLTIINVHDNNGYPECTATAYDKAGQAPGRLGRPNLQRRPHASGATSDSRYPPPPGLVLQSPHRRWQLRQARLVGANHHHPLQGNLPRPTNVAGADLTTALRTLLVVVLAIGVVTLTSGGCGTMAGDCSGGTYDGAGGCTG